MSVKIRFGTDGWRGRIAEDYTFGNVRRCAQDLRHTCLLKGTEKNCCWLR
jgi:phosphomannomutase